MTGGGQISFQRWRSTSRPTAKSVNFIWLDIDSSLQTNDSSWLDSSCDSTPVPDLPIGYIGLSLGPQIQGRLQQTVVRTESMVGIW